MASAQWLLNDTSVTSGSYWTAESGSSYKLKNVSGSTLSRITSSPTPYEGAGCYRIMTNGLDTYQLFDSSNNAITGGTYYWDSYVYTRSSPADDILLLITGFDAPLYEYTWVLVVSSGELVIRTYDLIDDTLTRSTTSSGVCPDNEWFRVQVKATAAGITETKLFKGTGINGTTPNNTLTFAAAYTSFVRLYGGTSNGTGAGAALDNIKFDNTAYPTRSSSTAHTAAGTATGTATGTAAMSNARTLQATATGTATGTAAASNQRTLAASASATASGTAAMSSTQAMSVSGSVTASGTAAMSRTQVIGGSGTGTGTGTANGSTTGIVTFGGTGTGTATGTGGIEKVTNLYRSGEVYRNVSLYPASIDLVTAGGTATGTATGTGGVEKVTNPYRFGNVYRNAGTYPGGAALVGCDPSIIVAAGSAAMTKTRYLEATATATATSDAGMTHTFYVFKPPTREISPLSLDPYYQLVGYFQGRTLVKRDGVWKLVQNRQEDWLDQCEYVFKGGRENRINGTEKAELESAGYTVETRTS
jgi:hypothetical protein